MSDEPDGSAVNPCAFRPLCLQRADQIRYQRTEIERLRTVNTLLSLRLAFWVGRDTVAALIAEASL